MPYVFIYRKAGNQRLEKSWILTDSSHQTLTNYLTLLPAFRRFSCLFTCITTKKVNGTRRFGRDGELRASPGVKLGLGVWVVGDHKADQLKVW